jgi:hypothetical protein
VNNIANSKLQMLLPDQIDFNNRWMAKAANTPIADVGGCIDKYVTVFVAYNALYNTVPEKVDINNGVRIRPVVGDKLSATTEVKNFIGAANLLSDLTLQNNDPDIAELVQTLQLNIFNIKLDRRGNPQAHVDLQLEAGLLSPNPDTKAQALLKIIYYVRCNVVHGRKNLQAYQALLLEPLISILFSVNRKLFNDLQVFPV